MSNNILTLQEIARLALSTLNEYLLFPHLCYRDFSDSPAELGDVAEIRMPAVLTAQDFDATNGVSYQDLTNDTTIDVELNHLATVDVRVPAGYDSLTLDELNQVLIKPAAEALAKKINTDGMKLCMEIANTVGTPGVTPSSLSDIIATRTTMTEKGIPIEDRVGIWNPDSDVLFNQLSALSQPETDDAGKYALGRVCGIDNYMSPDVPQHTVGTAISNNAALMLSVAAKQGDTKFSITGGTDKTLKRGDILLINNVHYVVAEDI